MDKQTLGAQCFINIISSWNKSLSRVRSGSVIDAR